MPLVGKNKRTKEQAIVVLSQKDMRAATPGGIPAFEESIKLQSIYRKLLIFVFSSLYFLL